MPVSYKLFILAKIRSVDPFLYLDLAPACLLTFMGLQKILKSTIFIETSQWEKSAEPRTEVMNASTSLFIQENTALAFSTHAKMRQNIPIHGIELDQPCAYQFLWCFSQIRTQTVHIHGIQHN